MINKKRGNKRLFVILNLFLMSILLISVISPVSSNDSSALGNLSQEENQKQDLIEKFDIPASAYEYVENFAENNGIDSENIQNVSQIDFNSLPKEVNIENIGDNNLAIYQIDYSKSSGELDKLFVITYSVEKLNSQGDLIISEDKREFLNFGLNGQVNENEFLDSATGVKGSLDNGYVMMRKGSITGISTSFNALSGGAVEIIVYKNGEQIQFGNSFMFETKGAKKDYDTQSKDTVSFEPGDVISVYVKTLSNTKVENIVTLLEITTNT